MNFERGFKTWAERTSASLRQELKLLPHEPLSPTVLAGYLDVALWTPMEVPGITREVVDQLLNQDPWGWSAVSVYRADRAFVIYNPRKSAGRRASDIMHELAHLILSHKPATVVMSQDGSFVMRSYDQAQEDEANWLAWCILLPRDALLRCRKLELSVAEIAEQYDVTETLVNFRLRMTGVESQLRAASARRKFR
jgi:Zn-dependent peptidase ImmA (M78 family)